LCALLYCLCSRFACREKLSWRGQSSRAWLITSSCWVKIVLIRSRIVNVEFSTQSSLRSTSRKIGPAPIICYQSQVFREVLSCSPLDSIVWITYSPKKPKIFTFLLSYCPL
jgi:hypothetical protein